MAFLAGLRAFSALVFEPLIVANAVTYGSLGTVLIVQSWLIGVGWVVYGGQLFGRWFYQAWIQGWAASRRGRRQPGGGQEGTGRTELIGQRATADTRQRWPVSFRHSRRGDRRAE